MPAQINPSSHLQLRVDPLRLTQYAESVQGWVTQRLTQFLAKQNRDGSRFAPTVSDCLVSAVDGLPTFLAMTFNPEAFWHIEPERVLSPTFTRVLSADLRRPVFAYYNTPDVFVLSGLPVGPTFVVTLRRLPRQAELSAGVEFPRVVKLDLAARNGALKNKLLEPLGVDRNGKEIWKHVRTLQHILFVGATGSGKSTTMQASLAALLTQNDPALVRVALIDIARTEFVFWKHAPHVFGRVAHDIGGALGLLKEIECEVARRGTLLNQSLCRSIEAYNVYADQTRVARLPYLLLYVDEGLELVMPGRGGAVVLEYLKRVAIGGRKTGVFLRFGTQNSSAAEGLSRVITTNLHKIAFRLDPVGARTVGAPDAGRIQESARGRMIAEFDDGRHELQGFWLDEQDLREIAERAGFGVSNRATNGETGEADTPQQDEIKRLIEWAVSENGGVLTQGHIRAMLGQWRGTCSEREARRMREALERDGILAKDARQNNRSCVTPTALERYGLSGVRRGKRELPERTDGARGLSRGQLDDIAEGNLSNDTETASEGLSFRRARAETGLAEEQVGQTL